MKKQAVVLVVVQKLQVNALFQLNLFIYVYLCCLLSWFKIKSYVVDDSKTNISNGDSESKPKDDNKEPEDSSSSKVNGTPVADENKEDVSAVAISSEAECGPSSSKEQNGSGKRCRTVRLTPYESDSEETDEDDEMFEVSENTK